VDAKVHFLTHGLKEGRSYKFADPPRHRHEFLARLLQYSSILEIGPFDSPVAREFASPTADLEFADWLPTDELKLRARAIPERNPEGVPHISYVARGKLADVITRKFDCVVSSHMIEHVPDFITHFNDVRSLLKPRGAYLFLCPDKRKCFDHFLPASRLPEVVTAYLEQRTRPTLRSVVEHRAFTRGDFANADDPLRRPNERDWATVLLARQEFESSEYVDVHCWQFTPDSLLELIEAIISLGLLARPFRYEVMQLGDEIGAYVQW
jgi:SAM-dependent methyltransferase